MLRRLDDADLDVLFAWERDPRAVQMAAFTRADPSDRAASDVHYQRIRNDPTVTLRAVDDDNGLVGTVASAGGKGRVSSYVATALADYQEQESLDELLAAWRAESPVPNEVQQQVEAELDDVGLTAPAQ